MKEKITPLFLEEQIEQDKKKLAELEQRIEDDQRQAAELREYVAAGELMLARLKSTERPATASAPQQTTAAPIPDHGDGIGLRDAIREAVKSSPAGLRPKQITARLRGMQHFRLHGNTDLSLRVGNELWRMTKKSMLKKKDHVYYMP